MDGYARFAGIEAAQPVEMVDVLADPEALSRGGVWFVVADFDGPVRAWRFADVRRAARVPEPEGPGPGQVDDVRTGVVQDDGVQDDGVPRGTARSWDGPRADSWSTSLTRGAYTRAVSTVREAIRDGEVYQANICRVLSAPSPHDADGREPDPQALAAHLARGNPAPYQGVVHVPASADGAGLDPVWVVTASPELFLRVDGLGTTGPATITSGPIKGTAAHVDGLTAKDEAENVMITDLVRNDLQQLCAPGSVTVTALLDVEHHPGLVHLVSTVSGTLLDDVAAAPDVWRTIFAATFPPASVSGAPKSSALRIIDALETAPRGPYCGAVGWVDADRGTAELAVGIRTFWWTAEDGGRLRFGTGAGITWGSDPEQEWDETELKAARLIALASAPTLKP